MLAGRETGLASGSHRAAAVLLGRVEAGEGRAAYFLVALHQAVPLGRNIPRESGGFCLLPTPTSLRDTEKVQKILTWMTFGVQ